MSSIGQQEDYNTGGHRRRSIATTDTGSNRPDDEEDIISFFRSLGLHPTQRDTATRSCLEQLVLSVGDLRLIASQNNNGNGLEQLFPQLGIQARVRAWYEAENPPAPPPAPAAAPAAAAKTPRRRTNNSNNNKNKRPRVVLPEIDSYSDDQLQLLDTIADEAAFCFPIGKVFQSVPQLRDQIRSFAHKRGFAISSNGSNLHCTRCEEPPAVKNKRDRKVPVPVEKQRRHRSSTRVGCPFRITHAPVDWKNYKTNKSVRITKSSIYRHDNGCLPSQIQLSVETRKCGPAHTTVDIDE